MGPTNGDRIAWGTTEADLGDYGIRLVARRTPLDLPHQLVHCDLSGNVLFHALIFRWACERAWDQGGVPTPHHVSERVASLIG